MHFLNRRFSYGSMIVSILIVLASFVLILHTSALKNIPYYETMDASIIDYADLTDSQESKLDFIENNSLLIKPGQGTKLFSAEVSLEEGDLFYVSFDAKNLSEQSPVIHVDLYTPEYDFSGQEFTCAIDPGRKTYEGRLPYYRGDHPQKCLFRIFTLDDADIVMEHLAVDRQMIVVKPHQITTVLLGIFLAVFIISVFWMLCEVYKYFVERKRQNDSQESSFRYFIFRFFNNFWMYAILTGIVCITLMLLYQKANLSYPLVYSGGDEMGVFYFVKTIKEFGISLVNPRVGGSGADMFDYPYSDSLSFLIVKIISYFVDNVYVITNIFYFLNYFFISYSSAFVCRKMGMCKWITVCMSVLYAFSPFIQFRYSHTWLVPYFMIPFACLIAINILQEKVYESQDSLKNNKHFYNMTALSFFCAFTGMYYAFFTCAVIAAACVIHAVNHPKNVKKQLYPLVYILATITGVLSNIIPNILYIMICGNNLSSELSIRESSNSEIYGMKFVQLLLPRTAHRIPQLASIADEYALTYPLVNENVTASLGVVASIGFILSLLLLFRKGEKLKELSYLNIAVFLIATIGGIGSIVSVVVKPMRCYNRMSLIIMFLSLLLLGKLLEMLRDKIALTKYKFLVLLLLMTGLLDQTVPYVPPDYSEFASTRNFIVQIEEKMDYGDLIFQLPYSNWPSGITYKNHIGYIESDSLRWSYGAMQGREESHWQQMVASTDAKAMVIQLKEAGYAGIYLDVSLYEKLFGEEMARNFLTSIKGVMKKKPMVSTTGNLYFWDLRNTG